MLKVFGAKVKYARVAATARVWAPWLLEMGEHVYIDANVDLYNPFGIIIGDRAIVSRGSFLCTASHDYRGRQYKLTGGPIVVENDTWIAADCFIAPGVTVRRGAVVGARAVVTRDVDEWKLVAGNPATVVKDRTLD
ncbi:MAG: DapH/DapD/GlmU-related protein [Planctomycetota bacterium]